MGYLRRVGCEKSVSNRGEVVGSKRVWMKVDERRSVDVCMHLELKNCDNSCCNKDELDDSLIMSKQVEYIASDCIAKQGMVLMDIPS